MAPVEHTQRPQQIPPLMHTPAHGATDITTTVALGPGKTAAATGHGGGQGGGQGGGSK